MSLYGVPQGVYYGQNERVDELNGRLQSRQFPDRPLAPNFSSRPIMTKYSRFPVMDRRAPAETPIQSVEPHNTQSNFSSPTQNGPHGAFFNSVDVESTLRNQTVALQHGAPQGVYVPDSKSDLYKVQVPSRPGPNPHPALFAKPVPTNTFRQVNAQLAPIGKEMFNNHTRTQLRAMM